MVDRNIQQTKIQFSIPQNMLSTTTLILILIVVYKLTTISSNILNI